MIANDGATTLREAIIAANTDADPSGDTTAGDGHDVIRFAPALAGQTIRLSQGELRISRDLDVIGPGADRLTIDARGASRVLRVNANTNALVQGVTMRGGDSFVGGGVLNYGTLSLIGSTVRDNAAEFGGGVFSAFGALDVLDSAITHNTAERSGGGLYLSSHARPVALRNTTISKNIGRNSGGAHLVSTQATLTHTTIGHNKGRRRASTGGLHVSNADVTMHNSLVAANWRGRNAVASDVGGTFNAASAHNLIGAVTGSKDLKSGTGTLYGKRRAPLDARLTPLSIHGGPTDTHALGPDSPAVNNASNQRTNDAGLLNDQRGAGFERLLGGTADIGAYEASGTLTLEAPTQIERGVGVTLHLHRGGALVGAVSDVSVDWGDGTQTIVPAGGTTATHAFGQGLRSHEVQAVTNLGAQTIQSLPLRINVTQDGYQFRQTGGSAGAQAIATDFGDYLKLTEGDSFLAELSHAVIVGANPDRLFVSFFGLDFNQTAGTGQIHDALEIALLDADGRSLVPTVGVGRDAFFNQTESQPFLAAPGAHFAAGLVSVDIAHLAPQSAGTLIVRLLNNDGDTKSTVRVRTTVPRSALWGVDESGSEQTAVLFRYTNDPAGADPGFESFGKIVYRDSGGGGALTDVGRGVEALAINAEGTAYLALNRDLAGTQGPVLLSVDLDRVLLDHALVVEGGAHGPFNVEARVVGRIGVTTTGADAITGLAWHEPTDTLVGLLQDEGGTNTVDKLVKIDPSSGALLHGFQLPLEGFVNGSFERVLNGEALSFDSDGSLLVSDVFVNEGHDNTRIFRVDPATGYVHGVLDDRVRDSGDQAGYDKQTRLEAIAVDPLNGRVLGANRSGTISDLIGVDRGGGHGRGRGRASLLRDMGPDQVVDVSALSFAEVSGAAVMAPVPRDGDRALDTSVLFDVSAGYDLQYEQTSFNEADDVLYANLSLTNNGLHRVRDTLVVAVRDIDHPLVRAARPDGFTKDGLAYFDVSDRVFLPAGPFHTAGQTVSGIEARFLNRPGEPFKHELSILGGLNRAPVYESDPVLDVTLRAPSYVYDALAIDPDLDNVQYELIAGPPGMTIDATSGAVRWTATSSLVGSHSVVIRAHDGMNDTVGRFVHLGAFTDQSFKLQVRRSTPNRPPGFVTTPIVDAFVGVPYHYPARAMDPDGDVLTYAAPQHPGDDFDIDTASGAVSWTPTADLVGQLVPVRLSASDGHPQGIAEQPYQVRIHAPPGNHDPLITSTPKEQHFTANISAPPGLLVVPGQISRDLGPGEQTGPIPIDVRVPFGLQGTNKVDVFFLLDDTGSFEQRLFDLNGVVSNLGLRFPWPGAMARYPDGKLVVAGTSSVGTWLAQYLDSGALDTDFGASSPANASGNADPGQGVDGVVLTDLDELLAVSDMALLSQGRILLAGNADANSFAMARVNADGTRDPTFADDGFMVDPHIQWTTTAVAVQPGSGGIIALGSTLHGHSMARYGPDGQPDESFGVIVLDGFLPDHPTDLIVQPDDHIVVAGTAVEPGCGHHGFSVARFGPSGLPDDSFGTSGRSITPFQTDCSVPGDARANKIALQPDGRIVVSGNAQTGGDVHFAIARYQINGTLDDDGFGTRGVATIAVPNADVVSRSYSSQMAIGRHGQIVVSDFVQDRQDRTTPVAIAQYDGTGQPDSGFGAGGITVVELGATPRRLFGLAIDDAGEPILGASMRPPLFPLGPEEGFTVVRIDASGRIETRFNNQVVALIDGLLSSFGSVVDLAFGVGRFEDYGGIRGHSISQEHPEGRPFILNQPIVEATTVDFHRSIAAALERNAPGFGGADAPEAVIEALYQVATGAGFNGNDANGALESLNTLDPLLTQTAPGVSGDVAPWWDDDLTFIPDPARFLLPPAGTRGGVGFRDGALPIIVMTMDSPIAYRPPVAPEDPDFVQGINGAQGLIRIGEFAAEAHGSADILNARAVVPTGQNPLSNGATIQQAVDALTSLGALVVGLGTNDEPDIAPAAPLRALAKATGSVDSNGDPLYVPFDVNTPMALADGLEAAVRMALTQRVMDVAIEVSDPADASVVILSSRTVQNLSPGDLARFEIDLRGDGLAHQLELRFVDANDVFLGVVPVNINAGYRYDVDATDADPQDTPNLRYQFVGPNHGATIDPVSGLINWNPAIVDVPTDYAFTVRVADGRGGQDEQSWTVTVEPANANNRPPTIAASSPPRAQVGRPYQLSIDADDPDGDDLSFFLDGLHPLGMTIDRDTGVLLWNSPALARTQNVRVAVFDGHGGVGKGSFAVPVDPPAFDDNTRPTIQNRDAPAFFILDRSLPGPQRTYRYQALATDPDNDVLSFDLPVKPAGMVVDADTGTIVWKPGAHQLGRHTVMLRVRDGRGGFDHYSFDITVAAGNEPPVFTSKAFATAQLGVPRQHLVRAIDPEGTRVVVDDFVALDDLNVDSTGLLTWTPTTPGPNDLFITVSDASGATQTQSFTVNVVAPRPNSPPVIGGTIRSRVAVDQLLTFRVQASDPDNDRLLLNVDYPPAMSFDAQKLLLTWRPGLRHLNQTFYITVEADDGRVPVPASRSFDFTVVNQVRNEPPRIRDIDLLDAVVDQPYGAVFGADDPDGDAVFWLLDSGPRGARLDTDTGVFIWTPAQDQLGLHDVELRAMDSQGDATAANYTIRVRGANLPPQIKSTPATVAPAGDLYEYELLVTDTDTPLSDLRIDAVQKPAWLIWDQAAQTLRGTPADADAGDADVAIEVLDTNGLTLTQTYVLRVVLAADPAANEAPDIRSEPDYFVERGDRYVYQVDAVDPDGLVSTFVYSATSRTINPSDLRIDPNGLFTWDSQSYAIGESHRIEVRVSEDAALGPWSSQRFFVTVLGPNDPPFFAAGTLDLTVVAGQPFVHTANAVDPDGDAIRYDLDVSQHTELQSMSIDDAGLIRWQSDDNMLGRQFSFTVTASDILDQISASLAINLSVVADLNPPRVSLWASGTAIPVGSTVVFLVRATDEGPIQDLSLQVANQATNGDSVLTIAADGTASMPALTIGDYRAVATATDTAGRSDQAVLDFFVFDPANRAAPSLLIDVQDADNDAQDGVLTRPTPIVYSATSSVGIVRDYRLDIRPAGAAGGGSGVGSGVGSGGGGAVVLDQGTTAVDGASITLDPTQFANGGYVLRLTASDGVLVSIAEQSINIDTARLKLGNFSVSFTDLTVPIGGLPISVQRTYDTLNSISSGAFGHGWDMSLLNVAVRVDLPDVGPSLDGALLLSPFRPGTRLNVTMPDGSVEPFALRAEPLDPPTGYLYGDIGAAVLGATLGLLKPVFEPFGSSGASLSFDRRANFIYDDGLFKTGTRVPFNPAAPGLGLNYVLRDRSGFSYHISGADGRLLHVEDDNGRKLEVRGHALTAKDENDQVLSQVQFQRDQAGRIAQVIDPAGGQILYDYSPAGDLLTVTNRAGRKTHFEYGPGTDPGTDPGRPHFLTAIRDDAGQLLMRTSFDDDGRLEGLVDASGRQASFGGYGIDLGGGQRVEIVDDGGSQHTELVRDARGNVLRRIQRTHDDLDAASRQYSVTVFEYTDVNFPDQVTAESEPFLVVGDTLKYDAAPVLWRTQNTYDADSGLLRSTSDALGNTTSFTHDKKGNLWTTTDPLGNTTSNIYDQTSNPIKTWDAQGAITQFEYHGADLSKVSQIDDFGRPIESSTFIHIGGQLKLVIDASDVRRTFRHDELGNQTLSYQHWSSADGSILKTIVNRTFYDADGRVERTAQYEVDGHHDYGAAQELDGLTPLWTTFTFYNPRGQVMATADRFRTLWANHYDARGQLIETRTQSKDESGSLVWLVSRTVYDADGRATHTVDSHVESDPNTKTASGTQTLYDELGRVYETRRLEPFVIELFDDPSNPGYKISRLAPGQTLIVRSKTTTHRDAAGRVVRTVSPAGVETWYEYDAAGRQTAVLTQADDSGALFHRSEFQYDAAGRQVRVRDNIAQTDPLDGATIDRSAARETRYEYDAVGRQVATISPVVEDPDNSGQTIRIRTETIYDALGRRVAVREQIKQHSSTFIDASTAVETRYEYDDMGRLTAVILPKVPHPDPAIGMVHPRYEYGYDQYGNQTTIRDNVYQLDPLDASTIHYDHDGRGGDLAQDHDTRVTRFAYDHLNRQQSRTLPMGVATPANPDNFKESFTYDPIYGQQALHVDFEGRHTVFVYDNTSGAGGRLVQKLYFPDAAAHSAWLSDASSNPPAQTTTYTHDAFGRLIRIGDTRHGTTSYSHDEEGRLTQVDSSEAAGGGIVNYAYDATTGQLIRTWTSTDVAGTGIVTETQYAYDRLGRLKTVTATWRNGTPIPHEQTQYEYDLTGKLDLILLPNRIVSDYDYDALDRLLSLRHGYDVNNTPTNTTDDTPVAGFLYELDIAGRRTRADEVINGETRTFLWSYDGVGRLIQEQLTASNLDDYTATYGFDLVGNRILYVVDSADDAQDKTVTYTYDRNDRILWEKTDQASDGAIDTTTLYEFGPNAEHAISYAGDGTAQTRKLIYAGDDTSGTGTRLSETTYSYNLQGRLSRAVIDDDGDRTPHTTITYTYGDDGIRTSKTTTDHAGAMITTRRFVIDGNNLTGYAQVLEEHTDGSGIRKRSYTIGHDVLSQQAPSIEGDVVLFLLADGHGSTRLLADLNAAVPATNALYDYDAYGNAIGGWSIDAALTTLLYSGEQFDAKLQMQYLRARYYDAPTGRFNRVDPFPGLLGHPQSFHDYIYVHGNPVMGLDPSGLVDFNIIATNISQAIRSGLLATSNAFSRQAVVRGVTNGLATVVVGQLFRLGGTNQSNRSISSIAGDVGLDFVTGFGAGIIGYGIERKLLGKLFAQMPLKQLVTFSNLMRIVGSGALKGITAVLLHNVAKTLRGENVLTSDVIGDLMTAIVVGPLFELIGVSALNIGKALYQKSSAAIDAQSGQIENLISTLAIVQRRLINASSRALGKRGYLTFLITEAQARLNTAFNLQYHSQLAQWTGSTLAGSELAAIIGVVEGIGQAFSREAVVRLLR